MLENSINQRPQKPTGTFRERMSRLQKESPPGDFKILLNPQSRFTLSQAEKAMLEALERVEAYEKNGHSCEGLWFSYASVQKYSA